MKQNFSKLLAAFVLTLMAVTAQATPYKNIYVTIEVVQTGAGTVYLEAPSEVKATTHACFMLRPVKALTSWALLSRTKGVSTPKKTSLAKKIQPLSM